MKNLAIIFFLIISLTQTSFGCSCGGEETVEYHYRKAKIVFHGKLIESAIYGSPDTLTIDTFPNGNRKMISVNLSNCYSKYIFKINNKFKGFFETDTVEILAPISSSCDLPVELNKDHIVYGYNSPIEGKYYSDYCSGTDVSKNKNLRRLISISTLEYEIKNDTNFHQFLIDSWITTPKDTLRLFSNFQFVETGKPYSQINRIGKKKYELLMWSGEIKMETPTQTNNKLLIKVNRNSFEMKLGSLKTKYLATRKKNYWELIQEKNYR